MGSSLFRKITLLGALVLVTTLASTAWADEVYFSTDTTKGCFGLLGCTPSSTSDSVNSLSFTGASVAPVPTVGGTLDLNLGQFTLTTSLLDLYAGAFTALITFDLPADIAGGQTATFTAPFYGVVNVLTGGGVAINFDCLLCNNTEHFVFANDQYVGSFDLTLNDVTLGVDGLLDRHPDYVDTAQLTGHISNATQSAATAVPEPASLFMLGSGLLLGLGRLRKRITN